jgi:hypothetical protein
MPLGSRRHRVSGKPSTSCLQNRDPLSPRLWIEELSSCNWIGEPPSLRVWIEEPPPSCHRAARSESHCRRVFESESRCHRAFESGAFVAAPPDLGSAIGRAVVYSAVAFEWLLCLTLSVVRCLAAMCCDLSMLCSSLRLVFIYCRLMFKLGPINSKVMIVVKSKLLKETGDA